MTHLPQIAALAERPLQDREVRVGGTALTTVEALEGDGVVEELVRMLGADASDGAARRHAAGAAGGGMPREAPPTVRRSIE